MTAATATAPTREAIARAIVDDRWVQATLTAAAPHDGSLGRSTTTTERYEQLRATLEEFGACLLDGGEMTESAYYRLDEVLTRVIETISHDLCEWAVAEQADRLPSHITAHFPELRA